MSVNLMHTRASTADAPTESKSAQDWARIREIAANEGMLELSEETVNKVAQLLEGVTLTNGERVLSYPSDGGEFDQGSYVAGFGPALLGEDTFRAVRTALEEDENGESAVALFDLIVELGLQILLSGAEFTVAHIKAVNWPADDVEVNTTQTRMEILFEALGLESYNQEHHSDDVPLDVFEKAVNDNAVGTGMSERLGTFIACAKRRGSTHVYWA